jgi:hypothetical protein
MAVWGRDFDKQRVRQDALSLSAFRNPNGNEDVSYITPYM